MVKNFNSIGCYAGVSTFELSSETSIRGKPRVSQFANKKMKKLFHMGAMAVICKQGELANCNLGK